MTHIELLHMYDDVGFFSADGICWACKDNLWFHIDIEGVPIYRQRYQHVYSFTKDGLALVYLAGQGWFHIKRDGNPAYKQRYTYASNFLDGVAEVYFFPGDDCFKIRSDGTRIA